MPSTSREHLVPPAFTDLALENRKGGGRTELEIRVRWLVLVGLVGAALAYELCKLVGIASGSDWFGLLFFAALYLVLLGYAVKQCRRQRFALRSLWSRPRLQWRRWATIVAGTLALSIGSVWVVYYPLSYLIPDFVRTWLLEDRGIFHAPQTAYPATHAVLTALHAVVVAPLAEEFLFRGLVLRRWTAKWGIRRAVLSSSIVFGMLHLEPLGATVFGIAMCVLTLESGTLWAPAACHALSNATALLLSIGTHLLGIATPTLSLDRFRALIWLGLLLFAAGLTWAIVYLHRRWPRLPPAR